MSALGQERTFWPDDSERCVWLGIAFHTREAAEAASLFCPAKRMELALLLLATAAFAAFAALCTTLRLATTVVGLGATLLTTLHLATS